MRRFDPVSKTRFVYLERRLTQRIRWARAKRRRGGTTRRRRDAAVRKAGSVTVRAVGGCRDSISVEARQAERAPAGTGCSLFRTSGASFFERTPPPIHLPLVHTRERADARVSLSGSLRISSVWHIFVWLGCTRRARCATYRLPEGDESMARVRAPPCLQHRSSRVFTVYIVRVTHRGATVARASVLASHFRGHSKNTVRRRPSF